MAVKKRRGSSCGESRLCYLKCGRSGGKQIRDDRDEAVRGTDGEKNEQGEHAENGKENDEPRLDSFLRHEGTSVSVKLHLLQVQHTTAMRNCQAIAQKNPRFGGSFVLILVFFGDPLAELLIIVLGDLQT